MPVAHNLRYFFWPTKTSAAAWMTCPVDYRTTTHVMTESEVMQPENKNDLEIVPLDINLRRKDLRDENKTNKK